MIQDIRMSQAAAPHARTEWVQCSWRARCLRLRPVRMTACPVRQGSSKSLAGGRLVARKSPQPGKRPLVSNAARGSRRSDPQKGGCRQRPGDRGGRRGTSPKKEPSWSPGREDFPAPRGLPGEGISDKTVRQKRQGMPGALPGPVLP